MLDVQTPTDAGYQFGQFEVNPASGELFKNGKRVKLQEQPFRLLVALLEKPGEVVTREKLRNRIWPEDTFVDFEGSLRVAVRKLRDALGDDAESPRFIETIPKRGYRFLYPATRPAQPIPPLKAGIPVTVTESKSSPIRSARWTVSASLLLLIIAASAWLLLHRRHKVLTEKDRLVLADFVNNTGDPVFDDTLRRGLAVQLEQSPFLSIISDDRIQGTLHLMAQPAEARLTPELAYSLCQRTQSAAVIEGSIANLGNQYIVGLKAVSCSTGDSLDEEQATAARKEQVLSALDSAAAKLRQRLGESLSSVQRFDAPLPEATTPSLEALQAYAMGRKSAQSGAFAASIPFFDRAIHLDPDFALAYGALGLQYSNLNEMTLSEEYVRKAYDLRARVTEREKLAIESAYYHYVTGDLEKARQTYELEAQTYPRDPSAPLYLWLLYSQIGQLDQGLVEIREAIRRDPTVTSLYGQVVASLTYLNRLDEARAEAQQDLAHGFDSYPVRIQLYRLAFLANDAAGMQAQVQWAAGKPGIEDELIDQEANTAAYFGEENKSQEFSRRAVASAIQVQKNEKSTVFEGTAALCEALIGDLNEAHVHATAASGRSSSGRSSPREALFSAALAFALAGDTGRAQTMATDLARRFPEDTLMQFYYLPTINAQIALNRGQAAKAIKTLQPAVPYDLAAITIPLFMAPVYVRGNAYLADHQGVAAASEFQKLLNHRGVVRNHLVGALAHLQLGRAYAMSGDTAKAKSAYQDFFNLWKNADPGIPILQQARAEYSKIS